MLTYIMQSSLSLSASHKPTCALTHTHVYCSRLLLYNHCPTRREQMPLQAQGEVGTLTLCLCAMGGLGTNTFLQSQARQCPSEEM